jgi:hypothetical protein
VSPPRQPDDVDPTGVRDLLAALPDPGPMPEDLVRRIEARLEVERASRASGAPLPSSGATVAGAADHVFDLAAERSHRRPARTVAMLGAAAAGLLVTSVAVTQLVGSDGGFTADTAAVYPSLTRDDGSARGAAQDGADEDADLAQEEAETLADDGDDAAAGDDAGAAGEDTAGSLDADDQADAAEGDLEGLGAVLSAPDPELGGRLAVLPHLGTVVEDDLVASLRTALGADVNSYGSQDLTLEEARSCWQVLADQPRFADYVAARADLGSATSSSPAVALMGMGEDGTGEVWALPESCTDGARVTPLTGPHQVEALSPR